MNEERDKDEVNRYLAKAMGLCWHENGTSFFKCPDCGKGTQSHPYVLSRVNFSTATGYDKLREFYDGWSEVKKLRFLVFVTGTVVNLNWNSVEKILHVFHKDRLGTLMYEFLKGEK